MQFSEGQLVRIKRRDEMKDRPRFGWVAEMDKFSDQIYVIKRCAADGHVYFEGAPPEMECWGWSGDMLAPYEESDTSKEWNSLLNL